MLDREAEKPVGGPDKRVPSWTHAYLGGARRGGKRGAWGCRQGRPIVVALETTIEGHPLRLKLNAAKGKPQGRDQKAQPAIPWSPAPP